MMFPAVGVFAYLFLQSGIIKLGKILLVTSTSAATIPLTI